jgi:hypothetical protein
MAAPAGERCRFCAAGDAAALYMTPLCRACACAGSLEMLTTPERLTLVLRLGVATSVELFSVDNSDAGVSAMTDEIERRGARLEDIRAGRAETDDPGFIVDLPAYLAQVGLTDYAARVIDRQRVNQAVWRSVNQIMRAA